MNIGGTASQATVSGGVKFSLNVQGRTAKNLSHAEESPTAASTSANEKAETSAIVSQALMSTSGLSRFAPTIGIEGGHSKYTQATLNSFSVAGKVSNSMRGSMMDMLQDYGGMSISGTHFGRASDDFDKYSIAEKMKTQQGQEIWENSEKLLEEAIEEIEQNAEDAAMPRDEQGNPIPTDENGNPLYDKDGNPLALSERGEGISTTPSTKPVAAKIETPTVSAADVAAVATSTAREVALQVEVSAAPALQAHSSQPVKGTEIDIVV